MMEHRESRHAGILAEFDGDDIAGMPPIGFHRNGIGKTVHGVENDEIGVLEEIDEGALFGAVVELVFGIG